MKASCTDVRSRMIYSGEPIFFFFFPSSEKKNNKWIDRDTGPISLEKYSKKEMNNSLKWMALESTLQSGR